MKKMMKEANFFKNSKEYKDVDPFDEEDWDEYELRNNDILYIFGLYKNSAYVAETIASYKSNKLTLRFSKSNIDDVINKKVSLNADDKNYIDKNLKYDYNRNVDDDTYISSIVVDFKLTEMYNVLHESIRKQLYGLVKKQTADFNTIENELEKIENKVINLKKSIKTEKDFPKKEDIVLDKNEYVVVKMNKNNNGILTIDTVLAKMDEEPDQKGGYKVLRVDTGEQETYVKDTYKKLIEQKHLIMGNKRDKNSKKFMSNDPDIYQSFVDYILKKNNTDIHKEIETERQKYDEKLKTRDDVLDKQKELRDAYKNFNFDELMKQVEKF